MPNLISCFKLVNALFRCKVRNFRTCPAQLQDNELLALNQRTIKSCLLLHRSIHSNDAKPPSCPGASVLEPTPPGRTFALLSKRVALIPWGEYFCTTLGSIPSLLQ